MASTSSSSVLVVAGGIGFVGLTLLYALRKRMSRNWIDISKIPELRDKRMDGQVVVVTGGNTGLGRIAAEEIAKRGPKLIILACRNVVAGNEAARQIKAKTDTEVRCMLLDLASLESVQAFVNDLRTVDDVSKVDTVVCNAGVWMPMDKKVKTSDGFEVHVGVNHLGHFLLVNLLIKNDVISSSGRVVVVSSSLASNGIVAPNYLEDRSLFFEGRKPSEDSNNRTKFAPTGYCDSKMMNVMFTKELVKRFPEVTAYSVCPGWCKTELARNVDLPWYKKVLMFPIAAISMRTSFQGAQNLLFAALEDPEKAVNGGFYRDGHLVVKEDSKANEALEDNAQLWDISAQLVNL